MSLQEVYVRKYIYKKDVKFSIPKVNKDKKIEYTIKNLQSKNLSIDEIKNILTNEMTKDCIQDFLNVQSQKYSIIKYLKGMIYDYNIDLYYELGKILNNDFSTIYDDINLQSQDKKDLLDSLNKLKSSEPSGFFYKICDYLHAFQNKNIEYNDLIIEKLLQDFLYFIKNEFLFSDKDISTSDIYKMLTSCDLFDNNKKINDIPILSSHKAYSLIKNKKFLNIFSKFKKEFINNGGFNNKIFLDRQYGHKKSNGIKDLERMYYSLNNEILASDDIDVIYNIYRNRESNMENIEIFRSKICDILKKIYELNFDKDSNNTINSNEINNLVLQLQSLVKESNNFLSVYTYELEKYKDKIDFNIYCDLLEFLTKKDLVVEKDFNHIFY